MTQRLHRPPQPPPHRPRSPSRPGAASRPTTCRRRAERRDVGAARHPLAPAARRPAGPYSKAIKWLVVIVVVENAARLSIPYLVKVGIDTGIPPIREDDNLEPLLMIVGAMLVATITQAITRNVFLVRSGTIGQDVLFEIRQRVFRHFQRLSPAFHDSYTSGRVISRQTSDVDAIYEMLESGFDGLVTAALTLVGTAALLLFLDVKLGLVALVCGPFLAWLTNWFRKSSAKSYRVTREKVALVIVHFVESMSGIRAVQAFRREPRNQEIFDDVNEQYRAANLVAFRLVAWFMPGIRLIGNVTIARRAHLRRLPGLPRRGHGRRARGVPALPAPVLRADAWRSRSSTTPSSRPRPPWRSSSGVLEEEPGVPEPKDPVPLPDPDGALTFDHVDFAYVEGVPVLPDLDLVSRRARPWPWSAPPVPARPRSPSSRPASTTRSAGRVLLDGVDLRDLSDETLHRAVVMVTQENYLFTGSVADNIRFGRPGAGIEEVVEAATALGADGFIRAAARGLRHPGRQPGWGAQRRPATAGRVRPGVPGRPGRPDPRRGDLLARHPVRAVGPASPAHHPRRPDRRDHRPPALDRRGRRPGAGDGARPDRRGRLPAGPDRRRRRAATPTSTRPGSTPSPDPTVSGVRHRPDGYRRRILVESRPCPRPQNGRCHDCSSLSSPRSPSESPPASVRDRRGRCFRRPATRRRPGPSSRPPWRRRRVARCSAHSSGPSRCWV